MRDKVDEALDETFPASDPAANTVGMGARIMPVEVTDAGVHHDRDGQRFNLVADGETAFLQYAWSDDVIVLTCTIVPAALRGRGIGGRLVRVAVAFARARQLVVKVRCPFAESYLQKHPELGVGPSGDPRGR